MTRALRQDEFLPQPPAGWLTVKQTAAALACSERTVRDKAQRGDLEGQLCSGLTGPAWYINPACKPALWLACGHTEPLPAAITGDEMAGLTAAQRQSALDKKHVIDAYNASLANKPKNMGKTQWQAMFAAGQNAINPEQSISARSLQRWLGDYKARGLVGLADQRGKYVTDELDPDMWRMFRGLYLGACQQKVSVCYELVAAEARSRKLHWPTLRTIQRKVNSDIAPIVRAAAHNPKRFEDRFLPYVDRDWSQVHAMDVWIADNRVLDLFCRVRKNSSGRGEWVKRRPWIQVWIDGRSWFPVAWSVTATEPDTIRTAELFAAGVSMHGSPRQIMLDNGAAFRADIFSGGRPNKHRDDDEAQVNPIVAELGVEMVRFAKPYNHKAKPIEPWFKFVSREFDKAWPSYLGHAVSHRPGEVDNIAVDKLPTLDEVRAVFGEWLMGTFCRQPSPAVAAAGLSPMRSFIDHREPGAEYARPSDETLCLLCRPSIPVRVGQNGIYVPDFGRWYWHKKLIERQGSGRDKKRKVSYRFLPGRPEKIYVFDENGSYYCTAEAYEGGGVHPLIDSKQHALDARAVAGVMELRGSMDKHYKRKIATDVKFSQNILLSAHRDALRDAGQLDDDCPSPPIAKTIQFRPHLEAAAQQMAAARNDEPQAPRPSLAEFFGTDMPETESGNDPQRTANPATPANPLDLLADDYIDEQSSGQEAGPWDQIDQ